MKQKTEKDLQSKIDRLEDEAKDKSEAYNVLLRQQERYEIIFETVPVSIIVVDCEGNIIDINPHYIEKIMQNKMTKRELLKQNLFSLPSVAGAGLSEKYRQVLSGVSVEETEVYFPMTERGTAGYFKVKGKPVFSKDKLIGAIFTHEEITELKETEQELRKHRIQLEKIVEKRTEQLTEVNKNLRKTLDEVRTLRGILPICSFCKKIRDDEGYWNQVEVYIRQRSDADFSHSVCPDCMKKHYPEYCED